MGSFLRGKHGVDYEQGFVQGAGRILIAPGDTAWPLGIEDILELTAGATLYDPVTPWDEVGFTKTGINIVRNNAEETFTVDQIRSAIKTRPSNWEMSVGTQLAEASLETFALAWELPDPVTVTKTAPAAERVSHRSVSADELSRATGGCRLPVPGRHHPSLCLPALRARGTGVGIHAPEHGRAGQPAVAAQLHVR
jgi:hypothetical protein